MIQSKIYENNFIQNQTYHTYDIQIYIGISCTSAEMQSRCYVTRVNTKQDNFDVDRYSSKTFLTTSFF